MSKMLTSLWQFGREATVAVLVTIFAVQPNLMAETHVVSAADLQKEVVAATRARQQNVETITQFFSSSKAEKALRSAHMDPTQVKTAVSALSDAELAQLRKDFQEQNQKKTARQQAKPTPTAKPGAKVVTQKVHPVAAARARLHETHDPKDAEDYFLRMVEAGAFEPPR